MEVPVSKFKRMAPGREVRLMGAYIVKCESVDKDENGNITCVHVTYDPESRGGNPADGRKIKGTIHYVAAGTAKQAVVRIYDQLFVMDEASGDYVANPDSVTIMDKAVVEPSICDEPLGTRFQFVRSGYYITDPDDSKDGKLVINQIVPLKSSYKPE